MADSVNNQVHASQAEVWYLKEIAFGTSESRTPVKIITQNFNGHVSLFQWTCPYVSNSMFPGHVHLLLSVRCLVHCLPSNGLSFAAGNILILRGAITIEPPGRKTASYEFLSPLVGEYLLLTCPGIDISAALSIMPYTQSECFLIPTRSTVHHYKVKRAWI